MQVSPGWTLHYNNIWSSVLCAMSDSKAETVSLQVLCVKENLKYQDAEYTEHILKTQILCINTHNDYLNKKKADKMLLRSRMCLYTYIASISFLNKSSHK